ncbi:MAG: uroporphyrinogen-III synthase [Candidatus Binataceae bacterium]|nr:uroporphyrinogen-III synthase [Candidatus Binataceae bacterium]
MPENATPPNGHTSQSLRIVAFESRMADETAKLIERFGCRPLVAPAVRNVELGETPQIVDFGHRLIANGFDLVVFLTGVGARSLYSLLDRRHSREDLTRAFEAVTVVARGPKTVKALRDLGIAVTIAVPEPNTWRDLLSALDQPGNLTGRRIAVQEYGVSNPQLLEALRARGAEVTAVAIYSWALPEDCQPLREAIGSMIAGEQDVVLFTSASQAANLLELAQAEGKLSLLREACASMLIGSIGPICSEALRDRGLEVDFEPPHGKLAQLIKYAATHGPELLKGKRRA